MNRNEFRRLAATRLDDARVLLQARRYAGAYYLAGYAVECALKACIARQTRRHDFPPPRRVIEELYTHDLTRLVKAAGLTLDLQAQERADPEFGNDWLIVSRWSEQSRCDSASRQLAIDFVNAIDDPDHGVLAWVRRHW